MVGPPATLYVRASLSRAEAGVRIWIPVVCGLFGASPALAGKKDRPVHAAPEPAAQAPSYAPGPDVGCWVALGATRGWRLETDAGVSSTIELVVREVDGPRVIFEVLGESVASDGADPFMKAFNDAMRPLEANARVRWDRGTGGYELLNLEDMTAAYGAGLDAALAAMAAPPEAAATMRANVLTPESVTDAFVEDLVLLTQFACGPSVVGAMTLSQRIENPVLGGFVPAISDVTVSVDGSNLMVADATRIDDAQWQAAIDAQLVVQPLPPMLEAMLRAMKSTSQTRTTIDLATGLVSRIDRVTSRSSAGGETRTLTSTYTPIAE